MMSQISNAVEVTVLPPYIPSAEERASPAVYAKNVQGLFCRTLGIPAVDQVSTAAVHEECSCIVQMAIDRVKPS